MKSTETIFGLHPVRSMLEPQSGETLVVWKWVAEPMSRSTTPDRVRAATWRARVQAVFSTTRSTRPSQAKENWQPLRWLAPW